MKKLIWIGVLILSGSIFANNQANELNELKEKLTENQQLVFTQVFDTNEKLIDSYKVDLKYVNSSNVNYEENVKKIEEKIKELEKFKFSELEKLKKDLINHPERCLN